MNFHHLVINLRKQLTVLLITMLLFQGIILPTDFSNNSKAEKSDWDSNTIYVFQGTEPDGNGSRESPFQSIRDALNISENSDIIRVFSGIYNEKLIVSKQITIIGNGTSETIVDGGNGDVITVTGNRVKISELAVTGYGGGAGIKLESANSTVTNTLVTGKHIGIFLYRARNNTLSFNNCSENNIGIYLEESDDNLINDNTFSENKFYGIKLKEEKPLRNRILSSNEINGLNPNFFYDQSGTESESIIVGELEDSEKISAMTNLGFILLYNCSYFQLEDIRVNYCNFGIRIFKSSHIKIFNSSIFVSENGIEASKSENLAISKNNVSQSSQGIILKNSVNSEITNNRAFHNIETGINLNIGCKNNEIIGNTASGNQYGIYLEDGSQQNILENNSCTNNSHGIYIYKNSGNNFIRNNNCSHNQNGISLSWGSGFSEISNNTCRNNDMSGISLFQDCNQSVISNNTCSDNFYGFSTARSWRNIFRDNRADGNTKFGFYLEDRVLNENIISPSNIVNGRHPKFYMHLQGTQEEPVTFTDIGDSHLDSTVTNIGFIVIYNCTYIRLENISIIHSTLGILTEDSNNITLNNSLISNSESGIFVKNSDSTRVVNCNISNNSKGIQLAQTTNFSLYNNSGTQNSNGISLSESQLGEISHNHFAHNTAAGIAVKSSSHLKLQNNSCGKGNTGLLIKKDSYNITIEQNDCTDNEFGVSVENCHKLGIFDNSLSGNDFGIYLSKFSGNNSVNSNILTDNSNGIYLSEFSGNNSITSNILTDNSNGIYLSESWGNKIENNTINDSDLFGIYFENEKINRIHLRNNTYNGEESYLLTNIHGTGSEYIILENISDSLASKKISNIGYVLFYNCSFVELRNASFSYPRFMVRVSHSQDIFLNHSNLTGGFNSESGAVIEDSINVSIRNCTLSGFRNAVQITSSSEILTENNNFFQSNVGVNITQSHNCTVKGNSITGGNWDGINITGSESIILTNNSCSDHRYGISLRTGTFSVNVSENRLTETHAGIFIEESMGNITLGNNHCRNNYYGIFLVSGADDNILVSNNLSNNTYGIYLDSSANNIINKNTINNSTLYGIYFKEGILNNNIVTQTNAINDVNPMFYNNLAGTTADRLRIENLSDNGSYAKITNLGFLVLNNCSNMTLGNISVSHTDMGITVFRSENITISNCSALSVDMGIMFHGTKNSIIRESSVLSVDIGIMLHGTENSIIRESSVSKCEEGILFSESKSNQISQLECQNNTEGVVLETTAYENAHVLPDGTTSHFKLTREIVLDNSTFENNENGVVFKGSCYNILENNSINNNTNGILVTQTVLYRYPLEPVYYYSEGNYVRGCDISGNQNYGMKVVDNGGLKADAKKNYWGSPTGPYHAHENPLGTGDLISDYINFAPWTGKPKTVYNVQKEKYYAMIGEAIDNAEYGDDIRVHEGVYIEDITVTIPLNITGNSTEKIRIKPRTQSYYPGSVCSQVVKIVSPGVTFRNFGIFGEDFAITGISIKSDNVKIINNTISGCDTGILLANSSGAVLRDNNCSENQYFGIQITNSDNNHIRNNSMFSHEQASGMQLIKSHGNKINYNNISGQQSAGMELKNSRENTIVRNSLQDTVCSILLKNSGMNTIEENNMTRCENAGILILESRENSIKDNIFFNNENGILAGEDSDTNRIENNSFLNNENGISAIYGKYIEYLGNFFQGNKIGLKIKDSSENIIENNTFTKNNLGICLSFSNRDKIKKNRFDDNSQTSINLTSCSREKITLNEIGAGSGTGILVNNSEKIVINNNTIYENFIGIKYKTPWEMNNASHNNIFNNTNFGINVTNPGSAVVNAVHSYWGVDSGPFHPEQNPGGEGNAVSDGVIFNPYCSSLKIFAVIEQITPGYALSGEGVNFKGSGISFDSEIVGYQWFSSLNNEIYKGFNDSFSSSSLGNGTHKISLRVQDNKGRWSENASSQLIINGKPVVRITDIPNWILEGQDAFLNGTAHDDGEIVRYVWSSSWEGVLQNSSSSSYFWEGVSWGERIIYFSAVDDMGCWSDPVSKEFGVYQKPTAHIDELKPIYSIKGDEVYLKGHGEDYLGISTYVWSYSGKIIATSPEFRYSEFDNGTHEITLKVKNTHNVWSDPVTQTIHVNGIPEAEILSISPNPALMSKKISFRGKGIDDSSISRFVWNSSIDGEIYNGTDPTFSYKHLSSGRHNISFRVMDENGLWSEPVNETLIFTRQPVALIEEIQPNPATYQDIIYFRGNGTDDGNITQYSWRSDLSGVLYNGTSSFFNTTKLSEGTHGIYLKVRDDFGIWSKETYAMVAIKGNVPPVIQLTDPEEGSQISGNALFKGTCWDDKKVTAIQYQIKGSGIWESVEPETQLTWNFSWDSRLVGNGNRTIIFRSYDGNQHSEPVSLNISVLNQETTLKPEPANEDSFLDVWLPFILIAGLSGGGVLGFVLISLRRTSGKGKSDRRNSPKMGFGENNRSDMIKTKGVDEQSDESDSRRGSKSGDKETEKGESGLNEKGGGEMKRKSYGKRND